MDAWRPLLGSPGLWLVPVMAFFVGGTAWEFGQLASRQVPIRPVLPMLFSLVLIGIASIPIFYRAAFAKVYPADCPIGVLGWIGIGSACACGFAGLVMLRSYATGDTKAIERWAFLTLIPTYAGGLGAFWIAIRLSGAPLHALTNLVGVIAVTKITDASAYFAGKSLGRTKLCPNISPGKTVEGAVAGLLSGMLAAWLYFGCIIPWMQLGASPQLPWWGPIVVGGLLGIIGLIGDLIESVVKRTVGAKDSGNMLPGLGGIWDVTDSLLPTAVVGYLGIVAHWI